MAFGNIYKIIFEVQILHEYFLNKGEKLFDQLTESEKVGVIKRYDVNEIFDIQPTAECLKQLKKYHLVFKKSKTGFFVVAEVKHLKQAPVKPHSYIPIIPFDEAFKLTFSIKSTDPYFYSYTVLPFENAISQVYFFSNRAGTNGATYPALSLPIGEYTIKKAYRAGDFVLSNNKLYEARINMTAANNSSFKTKNWKEVDKKDYVNERDKIVRKSGFYDYIFSQPGITHAQFMIQDYDGKTLLKEEIELKDGHTFTGYNILLSSLSSGFYRLTVEGNDDYQEKINFYFEKSLTPRNIFGIIEINHLPNNAKEDYQLINSDKNNEMVYPLSPEDSRKPVYQLLFKNRSTIWRYNFSKDQEITNQQLGDFKRDGGAEEKRKFITKESKPLTQYPVAIQKFNQVDQLLPGPTVGNLKPEKDKIYSEIYI